MSHELQINSLHLSLSRYPKQATNDLQAWNAADELMLNFAFEQTTTAKRILIMNDEFGALACALLASPEFADSQIHWLSDSFIAQQALAENLKANNLTMDGRLTLLSSTDSLPASDMVLMRQPKSLNYLEYQLIALQAILSADSLFACGVMLKNLPKSVFSLFEKHLGEVSTSLAKKKARLLFGHYQGISSTSPYPKQWKVAEHQFKLNDHANVFCFGKLDIGSRFMLDNFPQGDFEVVVDLGCGNGLLGLQALKHYPKAKVSFCDESAMALASAKNNVSLNFPERLADCEFNHDNALQHQADNSADLVLCNPPFHQQNTISTHIAQQMFRDAKRCLRSGGQLIVVANRHLGYHPLLKSYFGGYKLLASNNKFVILSSTKR
ncbi:methyltransferase [Agarivorans albus]|uniref:Ribosomal RNA large subunit methyltransferase G n=1 Tax=Agarivorans albus MKT 106 TaxID=1331007 RepID=R9PGN9_AGAAL|nr:methyltransferase [Agarivorans albus]GAD00554.1 23S rRNA (guanine-N-2-) -methyltransferase rlmG [Agarivorans albus MKT 106]